MSKFINKEIENTLQIIPELQELMCTQGELTEKDYDVLKFLPNNQEKNEGKLTLSRRRLLFTTRITLLNREIDKENKR